MVDEAKKEPFASVTLKLERRGASTFRLVWEQTKDGKREVSKTEWAPRTALYAHVARKLKLIRAFVFDGMGRIPGRVQ